MPAMPMMRMVLGTLMLVTLSTALLAGTSSAEPPPKQKPSSEEDIRAALLERCQF